ncbi:MAG: IS3 family transposase [Kiritimatiellae bacterium]|nr:IS3 family transposase [Kiritimatiellia bacterium]
MANKITITPEIKAEILKQYYDTDVEVKALAAKHGISRQTIYNWTKGMRRKSKPISIRITQSNKALWAARNHSAFEARVNSILRNANVSPNACLRDKLEEMARLHAEDKTAYPVKSLCAAMQVSRGAFYGYTRYGKHGHAWFDIHIAEIEKAVETVFNEMEQRFGAEKLTAKLKERGYHTYRATVKKIMKRLGLRNIRDGAKRQWRLEHRNPKDHVHRQFNPKSPNAVWVSDVTEWEYKRTKYYICVIIDLFSRRVVAHRIGLCNSTHLVKLTFMEAWKSRSPSPGLVYHSDRGPNFRSFGLGKLLLELGVLESFSRPHTPYDNSVNEAFFKSLKTEELYRRRYSSAKDFKDAVSRYVKFYNEERPHQAIRQRTPARMEELYLRRQKTEADAGPALHGTV